MELTDYIEKLEKCGYLKKISHSVNWKYEIGELSRINKSVAVLFDNINDYPGCRLFTGGMAKKEFIAMIIGLNPNTNNKEMINELKKRINNPVSPSSVKTDDNPIVSENENVNIFALPVPWWHPMDSGRYVGTWHLNITNDPVTGKRNVGVYRMQVICKNRTTVSASPESHLAVHMRNAELLGKDLEMAVAIGVNEAIVMAAAASLPFGVDEYSLAGGILNNRIKISPCKVVNLQIPYESQYVLEGVIKRGVRVKDGPFMDYAGKLSVNTSAFLFEIRAISRKINPVFRGMSVGVAGAEDHQLFSILSHVGLVDFHGSVLRQKLQNFFLKYNMFRSFQYIGRIGKISEKMKRYLL